MPTPPTLGQLKQAIDIYLKLAYQRALPERVRQSIAHLETAGLDPLACSLFMREPSSQVVKYNARLGNQTYPHMKMSVEYSPDGGQHFFRVDTHDRHCCPKPTSHEYAAFCALMDDNQKLANVIEQAWEAVGVPTFKSYLREDVKRRQAALNHARA